MAEAAIPVVLLTGFLGAGKTRLLNWLLRQPGLANTAVLINEFGDVGIDHLLVARGPEDVALLDSGCLCCAGDGELASALAGLLARHPARVVIETSGLADPAPIIRTLLSDPDLARQTRFAGIVAVIDGVHGAATLDGNATAARQAALADVLVLSKTDLAPAETIAALQARLGRINPGADQFTTQTGAIFARIGLFDDAGQPRDLAAWLGVPAPEHDHHDHDPAHDHAHDHAHDSGISAFSLRYDAPLHWDGIGRYLEMLVALEADALLRLKAVLHLAGIDRPVVLHGVRGLFPAPELLDAWPAGDPRSSRLVFITQGLDRATIAAGIAQYEAALALPAKA